MSYVSPKLAKRFDYQTSVRLDDGIKYTMKLVCEKYKMREADYIRKCIEKNLVHDSKKVGVEPKFHSFVC